MPRAVEASFRRGADRCRCRRPRPGPAPAHASSRRDSHRVDATRVRRARVPHAEHGQTPHQGRDPEPRVGRGVRPGRQRRRGLHRLPASKGGCAVRANHHQDRTRSWLRSRCSDMTGHPLAWRHRVSLRLRITVITVVVVGAVAAVGVLLALLALRSELIRAADEAVELRAGEVAELATRGALPTTLPPTQDPETFAEVVADGQMVTATEGLEGHHRFALSEVGGGEVTVGEVPRLPFPEAGPFRVVKRGVDTPKGPATVFVGVSIGHLEHTMLTATRIGATGLVVLVMVLAAAMWLAIGRALAPVEAIRVRADAIAGHNLDRRVPMPAQQDEIGRLARTVNQMLARLERSAEQQRNFVADAAHELRTPITSLRVQLENARDLDGGNHRTADMLHETRRMEGLVDQLLLLARADADVPWVHRSMVDLDDVIDAAVSSLETDGRITVDTSAVEPVQTCGDAALLEQVVLNLVKNALTHACHTVRVSLSAVGPEMAVLYVDDDGPGVPEGRRDDVFERFVRLDESRDRDGGGMGLGLAIVAEIVSAHGGHVSVVESPTGGARFVVELPTAPTVLSTDPA